MPGPFTHIYAARRVADLLRSPDLTENFVRRSDGDFFDDDQKLLPELIKLLGKKRCSRAMDAWPKFTAVGAIGPDLFFWLMDFHQPAVPGDEIMLAFSLLYYLDDRGFFDDFWLAVLRILEAEVPDPWAKILRLVIKLYQIWKDFVKVWNETIGPIVEKAGEILDDLSGQMLSTLGDAFTQLGNDLVALTAEEALSSVDIFDLFSLKMRKGYDEQSFMWSDMAHYRRTSAIPERLVHYAKEMLAKDETQEHGEQLLAFALGWICHVGSDTIAHSFVNEQCGGPFRTHWQRHHLLENHIDAYMYNCTKPGGILPQDPFIGWQESYDSLAESALYFAVQIPQDIDDLDDDKKQGDLRKPLPTGTDQASEDRRDELLDTDGALPPWLAETISKVLIDVFADPKEGGSKEAQDRLDDGGPMPHPRNLGGQTFQDGLKSGTQLLDKWLHILGVGNVGVSLEELREIIAPDPEDMKNVPEGFPLPWQMQATYRFMLSWLKRSYLSSFALDRPEDPKIFTVPPEDFDFPPPDFSGVDPNDDPVSQTCETVAALLDWLWKSIKKLAELCYDTAKMILSAATILPRSLIYYRLTLPMWTAAESTRMLLVHMGFLMPMAEKRSPGGELIRVNEIDNVLITLGGSADDAFKQALADAMDAFGNLDMDPDLLNRPTREVLGAPNPWLPVREVNGPTVVEFQRPWTFPDQNNSKNLKTAGNYIETPDTFAGPYPVNTMPNRLLDIDKPVSNSARKLYEDANCPDETDNYNREFLNPRNENHFSPLGDVIIFSTYLIGQIAHNPKFVSSFNLDADRGYGYLCWDFVRDLKTKSGSDLRRNHFYPPITWPEGTADDYLWQIPAPTTVGPNKYKDPLQVHYPGRTCDIPEGPEVPREF